MSNEKKNIVRINKLICKYIDMRKQVILLVLLSGFFMSQVMGQSKYMHFELCKELKERREFRLYNLSFVYDGDTLMVPQVGKNKYLNPFHYHKIEIKDSPCVILLLTNVKFVYEISILSMDLYSLSDESPSSFLDFCLEKAKRGNYNCKYSNGYMGTMSFSVIRKKRNKIP